MNACYSSTIGKCTPRASGRDEGPEPVGPPWPLSRSQLATFGALGLHGQSFEEFHDDETPPVRRFRAAYRKE